MTNFKVGDRVLFVNRYTNGRIPTGYSDTGTIIEDTRDYTGILSSASYAVCLDHAHNAAHTCQGTTATHHGYYCEERDLTLISEVRFPEPMVKIQTKKNILRSLLMAAIKTKDGTQDETKI